MDWKYLLITLENTVPYFLGGLFLRMVGFPLEFMLFLFVAVATAEGFFADKLPNTGGSRDEKLKGYIDSIVTCFTYLLLGYLIGGEIQP